MGGVRGDHPTGEKIIEADLSKLQREAPEQVGPEHCLFKIGPRAVHRCLQGARTSPTYPSTVEVATLTLEALIDTGFEGFLALPAELLGDVRPRGFQVLQVANDEIVTANYYSSTVRVGSLQPVEGELTALGSEAIVGRLLTDRYAPLLDHGSTVTLTE